MRGEEMDMLSYQGMTMDKSSENSEIKLIDLDGL